MRYGTICYLSCDDKTLMIKKVVRTNDPNSGFLVAPGGKLKPGEDIYKSIMREVKEESGLEIIGPELRGTVLYDNKGRVFSDYNGEDFYVYAFRANKYEGNLIVSSEEGFPLWIKSDELSGKHFRESDRELWELVSGEKIFSAVFKHRGEMLDIGSRSILFG